MAFHDIRTRLTCQGVYLKEFYSVLYVQFYFMHMRHNNKQKDKIEIESNRNVFEKKIQLLSGRQKTCQITKAS